MLKSCVDVCIQFYVCDLFIRGVIVQSLESLNMQGSLRCNMSAFYKLVYLMICQTDGKMDQISF